MRDSPAAVPEIAPTVDDLNRLQEQISRRAYDLFRSHEGVFATPLDDWFRAERGLVWRPAVELRDAVVISSTYGLGEVIVQGVVTPDEWIVFKPTLQTGGQISNDGQHFAGSSRRTPSGRGGQRHRSARKTMVARVFPHVL